MNLSKLKNKITKLRPGKDENKRIVLIDFLRGLVILMMIITHVIALTFDHSQDDKVVYYIGLVGGITSFTGFLFLSGISSYLSFVRKEETAVRGILKIFNREIKIFAIYYSLAVLAFFVLNKPSFNSEQDIINAAIDILTFKVLPEFTEFLPAFAIFTLSLIFLKSFYQYISARIFQAILVGLIIYFLGTLFTNIDLGRDALNSIKALFFGHIDTNNRIHSFPVFQYFIIFVLGLVFGKFFYDNTGKRARFRFILKFLSASIPVTIGLTLAYTITKSPLFYPMPEEGRFPPSLSFLSLSLSIVIIFLALLDFLIQYIPEFLNKILVYLSKNSLGFLFTHLIVLLGFKYYFDNYQNLAFTQPKNIQEIAFLYFVTMLLSWLLVYLSEVVNRKVLNSEEFHRLTTFTFRFALPNFILVTTALLFGYLIYSNLTALDVSKNIAGTITKRIVYNQNSADWWDNSYKIKRNILISNNAERDYSEGQWVQFSFNHKDAYNNDSSYFKNGSDLVVVHKDPSTNFFYPVKTLIENPNSENTLIKFQLLQRIVAQQTDENYFLYLGNADDITIENLQETPNIINTNITVGAETRHQVQTSTNKLWFTKHPSTKAISDELVFEANLSNIEVNDKVSATYSIPKANLSGPMNYADGKFRVVLDIDNLEPSVYTIQVEIIDLNNNLKIYKSYETPFKVTYPLYVNWSMDWEGFDVAQFNLNELDNIANTYGIPVTQLFNPRIYVEEQTSYDQISKERADYLTNWVLDRKASRGDEIGMHIHMFSDMVKEAGVSPRPGSIIGAAYGDTKTSDFTLEELEKIFRWGFEKFTENGLPRPITYRTGGWFSGPHVLKAVQNVGFLIDTSGRTGGLINPSLQYSSPVPWNLSVTTRPYKPTDGDINRWEGTRLNLWEFPNNGADSYWFNTNDLISRFDQNYTDPRGILEKPQTVTYLSHPHWLAGIDSPKLHALFRYLTQFLHKNDNGPVIFATLEDIYDQWDKVNDINGD